MFFYCMSFTDYYVEHYRPDSWLAREDGGGKCLYFEGVRNLYVGIYVDV